MSLSRFPYEVEYTSHQNCAGFVTFKSKILLVSWFLFYSQAFANCWQP